MLAELTFKRIATPGEPQQEGGLAATVAESSEESSEEIFDLIARKPHVTAKELAQMCGVTPRAIEKQIAKLKREGRLIRIVPNKGGHWQVQKVDK
ncbi:MAG: HTH domain-containing protein [Rugosibacter sp.]|nr:MAG: HTH domain-containing protein [Rugosibacter sp.]